MAYGLPATALVAVAPVVRLGLPVTPDVVRVSPFLNPLNVAVNVGFASPYSRLLLSAVAVRVALVMVSCPVTKVGKSYLPAAGPPAPQVVAGRLALTPLAGAAALEQRAPPATPEAPSVSPFA